MDNEKPIVTDTEYVELTGQVLIELNEMLNFIAEREGKPAQELFPTFMGWALKETKLVHASLTPMVARVELRQFADRAERQAVVVKESEDRKQSFILMKNGQWCDVSNHGAFALTEEMKMPVVAQ